MRNKLHRGRQTKNEAIQRLLEHARYEVLPTATTEEKVLASVPKDVAVTVTASASKGLEATLVARGVPGQGRLHRRCRTWPRG